jgi:hypothetical protein
MTIVVPMAAGRPRESRTSTSTDGPPVPTQILPRTSTRTTPFGMGSPSTRRSMRRRAALSSTPTASWFRASSMSVETIPDSLRTARNGPTYQSYSCAKSWRTCRTPSRYPPPQPARAPGWRLSASARKCASAAAFCRSVSVRSTTSVHPPSTSTPAKPGTGPRAMPASVALRSWRSGGAAVRWAAEGSARADRVSAVCCSRGDRERQAANASRVTTAMVAPIVGPRISTESWGAMVMPAPMSAGPAGRVATRLHRRAVSTATLLGWPCCSSPGRSHHSH